MNKIHHVGYLIKYIDKAKASFESLGFKVEKETVYDEYRDVDIMFMYKDGYRIELVSPRSKDSVVMNLMERYKNSPYHICYETESIENSIKELKKKKFIQIDKPTKAPAIDNKKVCFMHNTQIGIIELLEI